MALTAQAKKGAGSVYDQGAGRVDVAAALDPGLEVSGTTDFGFVKWQEGAHETRTRTVTVTNPTDSATTVTPTLTGDLGAVTVSGPVTVAAHGSAEVTLTFDPNTAAIGKGSGSLVLTGSDGATAQTAVGYVKEPKRYRLKVVLKDRHNAAPSRVRLTVMGLDNSAYIVSQFAGSSVELTVPPGRYSIAGNLESSGPGDTTTSYATDLFSVPAVDLTGQDASVTVDGTKAQDFELKVRDEKRPLENSTFSYQISRAPEGFTRRQTYGISGLASWSQERFGAIPVAAPAEGDGILYSSFFQSRREPVLRATVTRPDTYSLTARTSSYLNRFSGKTGYDIVDVGGGTAEEIAAVDLKGKAALLHLPNYTISHSAKIKAVEAAGASAIILAPTQESTLGLVVLGVKVPLFDVPYEEGRRLTADVAAGRTTVDVEGVRESRYHYSGQTDSLSGIPSDLSPDTKKSDYAKLRTSYHSDGTGRMGYHITHAWGPYPMTSVQTAEFLWQGSERDDYVLARPTNTYATQLYARTDSAVLMTENARTYQPDTSASRDWFAPVMHPSAVPSYTCSFCRFDAGMVFQPQLGGDGDASHFVKSGLARTWKYYRDGELINVGEPLLVPGKARYTFESTNTRPSTAGGVNLGGKTVTAYTFDSAEPTAKEVADCELTLAAAVTCEALPVVQLDYRLDTSLLNKVAADSWYAVTVDASRVKPYTGDSRMAGAKFSVSYDDGATWKPAGVIRSDGHSFKAVFRHPELADTNGFVSIKAEAWDQAGNRTAQTVTRAYALK